MADAEQIRRLIAYNQWADEKILAAVDDVPPEELARPRETYFGSIARNLWHVLNAQRIWLGRWKGEAAPSAELPAAVAWREEYATTHRALAEYLTPMTAADLDRVVHYKNLRGEPFALPLGQLVTHLVNHGTAHRAETGVLLERLGRSPGDLDYLYFALQQR